VLIGVGLVFIDVKGEAYFETGDWCLLLGCSLEFGNLEFDGSLSD